MNVNDRDSTFRTFIRRTVENHDKTPPACDDGCARWGDLPHGHICPDGLYEDSALLVITAWCSCNQKMGGPVRIDVREPKRAAALSNSSGQRFVANFERHMRREHGIRIRTDERWLAALATPPQ